jgi:N-acetyl-anhydromuramyl-L-alanine amidase AmpD
MGTVAGSPLDMKKFATQEEIDHDKLNEPERSEGALNELAGIEPPDGTRSLVSFARPGAKAWDNSLWVPHCRREYLRVLDHGPRPETRGVVIHVNDGYFEGTRSWFRSGSGGVGAHFEVGNSAEGVVQFLPLSQKAWHAVDANAFSIGVEHAGFGRRSEWEAGHMLELSANRVAWILHRYNLGRPHLGHNIWPHSAGGDSWGGHFDCPGKEFPWDKYLSMVEHAYLHHWAR